MRQTEYILLQKYFYNQKCRLDSDIRQLQHNIRHRNIDDIDCYELQKSLYEREILDRVRRDIMALLKIKT